jgi:hypothetical protein
VRQSPWARCREQQGTAGFGCCLKNEFDVVTKAEIEHLVRFVQHYGTDIAQQQSLAFNMVLQSAWRSHHDMCAGIQQSTLTPRVHATDTGDDASTGGRIEPFQLALYLHRQFARRRNDQGQRISRAVELEFIHQQGGTDADSEGHGLARAGLRRHQQIALGGLRGQHGALHRGQIIVTTLGKSLGEGGGNGKGGQRGGFQSKRCVRRRHRGRMRDALPVAFAGVECRFRRSCRVSRVAKLPLSCRYPFRQMRMNELVRTG